MLEYDVVTGSGNVFEVFRVYEEKQEPNYTFKVIRMLLKAGVTSNIHYVLSNTTIDEAIAENKGIEMK